MRPGCPAVPPPGGPLPAPRPAAGSTVDLPWPGLLSGRSQDRPSSRRQTMKARPERQAFVRRGAAVYCPRPCCWFSHAECHAEYCPAVAVSEPYPYFWAAPGPEASHGWKTGVAGVQTRCWPADADWESERCAPSLTRCSRAVASQTGRASAPMPCLSRRRKRSGAASVSSAHRPRGWASSVGRGGRRRRRRPAGKDSTHGV